MTPKIDVGRAATDRGAPPGAAGNALEVAMPAHAPMGASGATAAGGVSRASPADAAKGTADATLAGTTRALFVLAIVDDRALFGLLDEWLGAIGCRVVAEGAGETTGTFPEHPAQGQERQERAPFDLVIVDVPFPRQGGHLLLQRVAKDYPNAPILALSSSFFPGIENRGGVAQALGVAYALPKPVKRDALINAVQRLLSTR